MEQSSLQELEKDQVVEEAVGEDTQPDNNDTSKDERPLSLREQLEQAFKKDGDKDGKEEKRQGRQEVLKQSATEADKTASVVSDVLKPIESWPDDVKQKFAGLPKEFQEFLLKRHKDMEGDYTRKTQEIAPIRKITQSFQPFFENIKNQYNIPAEQAISASLHTLNTLVYGTPEQKLAEWMNVAQQYGIPVNQLQNKQEEWVDPDLKALREQNAMLMQKFQQFENQFQMRQRFEQQEMLEKTNAEIDNFVNQKDGSGNLAHPFAGEQKVMQRMAFLADSYRAKNEEVPDLKTLYEESVFTLPEYRQKIMDQRQQATIQEMKKKAESAKRASKSITTSNYIPNGKSNTPKSIREELESAFSQFENVNRI